MRPDFFVSTAEVEIGTTSGALRVLVRPRPTLTSLLLTAAIIGAFAAASLSDWQRTGSVEHILEILVVFGGAVAWFQQLSGSEEEIEIGDREIRIRREILGWNRISEYSIERCSDLDIQTKNGESRRLQFRFGKWRTIEFGNHMSKEQAEKVLDALAESLPELARKLLPSIDITKHWTTLDSS